MKEWEQTSLSSKPHPVIQRSTSTSPLYRDYLPLSTQKRVQLFALQTVSGIHLGSPYKGKRVSVAPWGLRVLPGDAGRLVLQDWQQVPPGTSGHPLERPLVPRVITWPP